jgi:hypothetical protein
VHELGPELDGSLYLGKADGSCTAAQIRGPAYLAGQRIPNEAFVRAFPSTSHRSDGDLAFWQLNGDDGSGIILGLYDLEERAPCEPSSDDSEQFCVPSHVAWTGNWPAELEVSGIACRELLAESSDEIDAHYMVKPDGSGLRRVVPLELITDPARELVDCQAMVEPYRMGRLYAVGTDVALDEFPPLHQGRIRAAELQFTTTESATGALVLPRDWSYLNGVQHPDYTCELQIAADGAIRCLPGRAGTGPSFADAACTTPLIFSSLTSTPRLLGVLTDAAGTGHVFVLGDRFVGDLNELTSEGTCRRAPPRPFAAFYPREELASAEFPRFDRVMQ